MRIKKYACCPPPCIFFIYCPLNVFFFVCCPLHVHVFVLYLNLGPLHVFCFIRYGWGWRAPLWVEFCHRLLQNCKGFSISPLKLLHPCPLIGFEHVTYTLYSRTLLLIKKEKWIFSSQPNRYFVEELNDCCRKDGDKGTA